MERWREIESFPDYSVSDYGRVRNDHSGHIMALLRNQHGVIHVGLSRDRTQHKRSVAVLVAMAFLPMPEDLTFDTPINLDGDRSNNRSDNLVWRPRWFAVKYFRQFRDTTTWYRNRNYDHPIEEIDKGITFSSSWDAAITYGLLVREVYLSSIKGSSVWPTNQRFRRLDGIKQTDTDTRYPNQILGADITSR